MELTIQPIPWRGPVFRQAVALYHAAFPKNERFSDLRVRYWLLRRWVEGLAYFESGRFLGFTLAIVQKELVFVQYLAVSPEARGQGAGSAILAALRERYPGRTFFLDVEVPDETAPNAGERLRRIGFYQRNGFSRTGVPFKMRGVQYEVLSTDPSFSQQDMDDFWKTIS